MEPGYTEALKNQTTNKVERSIPDIFTHLFDNYGLVEPEEVIAAETVLQKQTIPNYHPHPSSIQRNRRF